MAKEVIINGKTYSTDNSYIVKDAITGEFISREVQNVDQVIVDLRLHRPRLANSKFTPNDNHTFNIYKYTLGYTLIDNLPQAYQMVVNTVYNGRLKIFGTQAKLQEIVDRLGFVLGNENTTAYFDPIELEYMDKPQPYRKFDFTYYKKTLEDVLGRSATSKDLQSPEIQNILKNLNKRNISMGVSSLTFKDTEGLKYTYGIELETCIGRFEDEEVEHLNLKAVHDGSLRGPDGESPLGGEYVSGVLTGDSGLAQLHEICRVLQTKGQVDKRCGVHVHIGNLNWTKEEVVYSYILAEMIEDELFSILPKSRRTNSYCRAINKLVEQHAVLLVNAKTPQDYNIQIDEIYDIIFKEVSGLPTSQKASREINKLHNHPKGSKCGFDKNSQRYCWLNYVTLLFNTKGVANSHTLEFRPMSGTLNYTKIKNWLKICMAFCSFVENHKSLIKNGYKVPVTLDTIISKVYPKTGEKLSKYVQERKQVFKTADESIDYTVDKKIAKKSMKEVVCA